MTTKEMIDYLRGFQRGQIITMADTAKFAEICDIMERRMPKGRPKKFEDDQARWRYHNERRKAERRAKKAIDIADQVL